MNFDRKRFYKSLFFLCIPIIVQNLISTLVNMIDTVMISSLGSPAIAAVGIANQFFFLYTMVIVGVCSGATVFISQFFGKRDTENIKRVAAFTTTAALVSSIVFFLLAKFGPMLLVGIFSKDSQVIRPALDYFEIIAYAYPLIAISMALTICSRSIRRPYLGMVSSAIALVVNVILNYGLILGNLGMPALGVSGAAIATCAARVVEVIIVVGYIFIVEKDHMLRFNINHIRSITWDFLKQFLDKSIPMFTNDVVWAIGTIAYTVAYSVAGTEAIAAGQIAGTTSNLFLLISICIANGGSIMLGIELGSGRIDMAITYAKKLAILVFISGLVMGGFLILSIPGLINIFHIAPDSINLMTKVFKVIGTFMALKSINTFIVISVLRSGGDTKFAMIVEVIAMWCFSIPATFYGAYHGYSMWILVAFTYLEEIVKMFAIFPRALSKKWANNLVNHM